MLEFFGNLDRRWIFLMMGLAVAVPIFLEMKFPEKPTEMVRNVFDAIEKIPEGSKILLAFDYEPATEGELAPMATAFVRHCCEKKHKLYFISIIPLGPQMIEGVISREITPEDQYPDMKYGEDYVNLGFKPGNEGVITVIVTDLKKLYTTDHKGTSLNQIPMTKDIKDIQAMDLILNVSGSYPGTKEWVQYAADPFDMKIVAGCTGVQAPPLYAYIPDQMLGILNAIKGAAEYEALVAEKYPRYDEPELKEGMRRMGPQLVAHLLMIGLIIAGNIIFFCEKWREARR